jgi:hypothetical protein
MLRFYGASLNAKQQPDMCNAADGRAGESGKDREKD